MLQVKVFATKLWNDTFNIGNLFVSKVVSHLAHEFFVSVSRQDFLCDNGASYEATKTFEGGFLCCGH
jgi:hypothetical protein